MKKKSEILSFVLMALLLCGPAIGNAKKVYYGSYVMYDGKVDGSGTPSGKGKLFLQYETSSRPGKKESAFVKLTKLDTSFGGLKTLYQPVDIVEGVFNGNEVANATVRFGISRSDDDKCEYTYKGGLKYEIVGNGDDKSIKLELTGGQLTAGDGAEYQCNPDESITILRTAHSSESIYTKSFGNLYQFLSSAGSVEWTCPIKMETIGSFQNARKACNIPDQNGLKFYLRDAGMEDVFFENGVRTHYQRETGYKIEHANDDVLNYKLKGSKKQEGDVVDEGVSAMRKHYSEGVATLFEKGTVHVSQNEGQSIIFYDKSMHPDEFYKKFMKTGSLQELGLPVYSGVFADTYVAASKGSSEAQYNLAMMYLEGKGIDKSRDAARVWLEAAVHNGYDQAYKPYQLLLMEELKDRARKSSDQYDSWIVGHIYEFGEGNGYHIDINLDSAIVWYKKAVPLGCDSEYVTAAEYKKNNNGADYWVDKKQREEKEAYDLLCKNFGKKYTDDALAGRITVGMPETLLVSAFSVKLAQESANSKLYHIYGWGVTNFGSTISNTVHTKSVWVRNGKVASITNWQ